MTGFYGAYIFQPMIRQAETILKSHYDPDERLHVEEIRSGYANRGFETRVKKDDD